MTVLIGLNPLPIAVNKINLGLVEFFAKGQKLLLDLFIAILSVVEICNQLLELASCRLLVNGLLEREVLFRALALSIYFFR